MQQKPKLLLMGILIEVIDAVGIEERTPALEAMDFVTLGQEELGEVGAVLAGDSGDKAIAFR
jgi:hypothetical protein